MSIRASTTTTTTTSSFPSMRDSSRFIIGSIPPQCLVIVTFQLPKTPESDGSSGDSGGKLEDENKAGFAVFTHFSENPSINRNQKSGNSKPRKGGGGGKGGKQGKEKKGGAKPKVQTSSGNIQPTIFGTPTSPSVNDGNADIGGSDGDDDAKCLDEECPFLLKLLMTLTSLIMIMMLMMMLMSRQGMSQPLVPLTLPSFLLVIAALFLSSSITSHPFASRPSFLPLVLFLLRLFFSSILHHTTCFPSNSSSPL